MSCISLHSVKTFSREKTQTACCFCGSNKDLTAFGGKQICGTCLEKLKNI
jgi:hypothetical protein